MIPYLLLKYFKTQYKLSLSSEISIENQNEVKCSLNMLEVGCVVAGQRTILCYVQWAVVCRLAVLYCW